MWQFVQILILANQCSLLIKVRHSFEIRDDDYPFSSYIPVTHERMTWHFVNNVEFVGLVYVWDFAGRRWFGDEKVIEVIGINSGKII